MLPAMTDPYARLIDGETRLMGVLGEHIAYTLSPRLHNFAANLLGINVAYLALPLPAAGVAPFLAAAWSLGAVGFNVTTPHKALVASLVPEAGLTSANTLYRGAKGWQAASTDGPGWERGLARLGRELGSFAEVVVLGSGGAAVAVLAHLGRVRAASLPAVHVLRRTPARDADVRAALPPATPLTFGEMTAEGLAAALRGKDERTLLVQATSAPQKGDDLRELVPALTDFSGVVSDLVYAKPSALYFAAVAKDLTAQDGEAMLIEQARLSQELWWGRSAPYADMALALRGK